MKQKKIKASKKRGGISVDIFAASLATVLLVLGYVILLKYHVQDINSTSHPEAAGGLLKIDSLDVFIENVMYLLILYPLQAVVYVFTAMRLGGQRKPIRTVLLCMPIHIMLIFINASVSLYQISVAEILLRVAGVIFLPYMIVSSLIKGNEI